MHCLGETFFKAKGLNFTRIIFGVLINGASFFLLYIFNFKDYHRENITYSF